MTYPPFPSTRVVAPNCSFIISLAIATRAARFAVGRLPADSSSASFFPACLSNVSS
jgi:hypothetical protein